VRYGCRLAPLPQGEHPDTCVCTVSDLSERQRAEDALREERDFSQAVLNTVGALVAVLDRSGRIVAFNRACEQTTGYRFEEVRGRYVWDLLIPPEQAAGVRDVFARLTAGNFPNHHENYWLTRAGGRRLIAWSNTCLVDAAGRVEYVVPTGVDITERQQAEEALRRSEERLALALQAAGLGLYDLDVRSGRAVVNPEYARMLGYDPDGFEETHARWLERLHPDDRERVAANYRAYVRGEVPDYVVEFRQRTRSGGWVWILSIGRIMERDAAGNPLRMLGAHLDISARKRAEEQMRKLSSAVEQTADAVMITDVRGAIEYVNPAFERMTGYRAAELLGRTPQLLAAGASGEARDDEHWRRAQGGEPVSEVVTNRRRDGTQYYEERTITPIKDADGCVTHLVATGRDITARMEAEKRLAHLAHHDLLTDLPNRVLFLDRLKQALARARWHDRQVAVLFLDVDRFKNINDSLGHEAGDALLCQFAERLLGCLRDGDTLARFGGDEFVILLDDLAGSAEVGALAARMLESLDLPFEVNGNRLHVTGSIGISLFPHDGEDSSALLKNADVAMYRAKDAGRNHYAFYSAEMTARVFERLNMENSLRQALARHELVLHYQPQVDARSGRVVGVEALLRWRHPALGLVLPDRFVPLLEETGLILPVGQWVLRTACAQLAAWRRAGLAPARVSINLSSRQFEAPGLAEQIRTILADHGLPPDSLEVEITESMLMPHSGVGRQAFETLAALGVRLAVDDFGTGYSSLSYLRRASIDALKVDRSFVLDLPADPDDAAVTQAIVSLGHSLRLELIAEGVETPGQRAFLQSLGCHLMQGNLFSPPLPAERLTALLQAGPLAPAGPGDG
jgi:diguanylate cyclase (GGDEF)-like protein/PAS domain S-box-containing protein